MGSFSNEVLKLSEMLSTYSKDKLIDEFNNQDTTFVTRIMLLESAFNIIYEDEQRTFENENKKIEISDIIQNVREIKGTLRKSIELDEKINQINNQKECLIKKLNNYLDVYI